MVNNESMEVYGSLAESNFAELAAIIGKLQRVRHSTGLVVSDELLLDAAVRLYITTQINKQKPFRSQKITSSSDEPIATDRQIKYLQDLGADIPERLSKRKASQIIEEFHNGNEF